MTVLKAIGSAAPSFLNHCYTEFSRALQKLVREHTTPITQDVKCRNGLICVSGYLELCEWGEC
jgi:hypothetical protein